MTTVDKLPPRKRNLLERLEADLGPNEREEIERLLDKINTALDLLDDDVSAGGRMCYPVARVIPH
jgi:hypothetical protein